MDGIERISRRLAEENQAEIDRVLGGAKAKAEETAARYKAQADAEEKELGERNERAAAEREERLVSMAHMESRKILLAARQEMVEQAYALALDKLSGLPEAEYVNVLADLLVQASSTGKEEAVFSAKDQKAGKTAVGRANAKPGLNLTLSKDTADIRGGFLLRDKNVEVNCAFETLVRLARAETSGAVAKTLFP
ncbi:MAG: V-type ATP synthase subunit E [Oscillibacter sp.]|nr:V-type ATP synthase subunit E [Oscillibacter sp.]